VVGLHKGGLETNDKKCKNVVLNIGVFIKDIIEDIKLSPKNKENIRSSTNKLVVKNNIIKIGFIGDVNIGAKTNLVWALVNEEPSLNFKNKY
jgi:hypothetical protein